MEPHAAYTMVAALLYDLSGDIWRGRDHDTVKWTWYGSDVGIAR
jgi:hypothetical protein